MLRATRGAHGLTGGRPAISYIAKIANSQGSRLNGAFASVPPSDRNLGGPGTRPSGNVRASRAEVEIDREFVAVVGPPDHLQDAVPFQEPDLGMAEIAESGDLPAESQKVAVERPQTGPGRVGQSHDRTAESRVAGSNGSGTSSVQPK